MSIPPGFERCIVCGEFNGTTEARHLDWEGSLAPPPPDRPVSVTCLCHGIPCSRCNTHLIHRPISNSYDEGTNTIGHWFYLSGLAPCWACRLAEERSG